MFTRWHSSMWAQWFSDSLPHPTLPPLKTSLSASLIWEFLGTDQVYDPVSLNQNKAGGSKRREKETKTHCVLLSRLAVLFTATNKAQLFLDALTEKVRKKNTQHPKNLQLCTLSNTINEACMAGSCAPERKMEEKRHYIDKNACFFQILPYLSYYTGVTRVSNSVSADGQTVGTVWPFTVLLALPH